MTLTAKQIQKYKTKTVPQLKARATKAFNLFIRNRDRNGNQFQCISCGKLKRIQGKLYQAGHYYPAGTYEMLRYNEHNVNGECQACNYFSGDHLVGYRERLVQKIGIEAVKDLEQLAALNKRQGQYKWDRISLIDIIEKYEALNNTSRKKFVL